MKNPERKLGVFSLDGKKTLEQSVFPRKSRTNETLSTVSSMA
ncbi:hypothetical protein [Pseudomonas sp. FG-3G]|jgi:hypothetical protein|nr:hypothetical protein [Pseudomonas sp. FG-3G]